MTETAKQTLRLEKPEWQALALNGLSQLGMFVQGTNVTSDQDMAMIDAQLTRVRMYLAQWHKTGPQAEPPKAELQPDELPPLSPKGTSGGTEQPLPLSQGDLPAHSHAVNGKAAPKVRQRKTVPADPPTTTQ